MELIKGFIEQLSHLIDKEQYRTALRLYERDAPSHFKTIISQNDRRTLLLLGAKIYYFNQRFEALNLCLTEISNRYLNIEYNFEFITLKFQLLSLTGKASEALEFITRAISQDWPQEECQKLNYFLGEAHFWNGDYLEANHRLQQCYRYFTATSNHCMLGNVTYMLGYTAFQRSFFDIAESFLERTLEHFRTVGMTYKIGITNQMMGILAYRTGRYAEAKEHLRLAKIHFQKCKSQTGAIESDIATARVSIYLEEYENAERLLLKSYRGSKEIGYKRGVALSAEFLGEIYYHRTEYTKSLQYLEIAEKLALELAPSGDIAVEVYRRLGDLFIARDEIEDAEKYLSKALDIGEHLNDRYELGSIYRAYGLLFARKENIDRARSFFMESIVTLQIIKERYELARTYITAADTYKQWRRANNLSDEYKDELPRDADTYEVEAMHLYQSLGLDHKVKEVEARRRGREKNLTRKDGSRFMQLRVDDSWLYREKIVARSSNMREVIRKVESLAPGVIPVFITGETGTGKEVVAGLLHQLSGRASGPFIPVNCASIPETVFESELFGHKRGSFTGAISDKTGLIERASGGTLFLDEISELTDRQQAKLLRTLEESSIRRIGETKERRVDVRVVSASNEDVGSLLKSGTLRTDFFFRISVERVELALLRERREDIMPLFAFYLRTLCGVCKIERDIPMLLEQYHWPGNVRELINIVKALAQLRRNDGIVRTSDLPVRIRDYDSTELMTGRERFIDRLEMRKLLSANSCREHPDQIRELIISSLERCDGNYSAAARELGIGRTTLYRRMQELDLL